jgi:hypothetical protein
MTEQVLSAFCELLDADTSGQASDDGADLVVACLVAELDFAERFQERRHIHPETTAIALAEAVPAADRVLLGATPGLNGALLGGLLLIGGAEVDPIALFRKPGVKVVDASELIPQLGRSDLAEERRWVGCLVSPHRVARGSGGSAELPWVVFGSCGHTADSRRPGQKAADCYSW